MYRLHDSHKGARERVDGMNQPKGCARCGISRNDPKASKPCPEA